MTRKDFEAIAAALKASKPSACDVVAHDQWRYTQQKVAEACAALNARFNRTTFNRACGLEE